MDDLIEWLRAQLDATDVECWGAAEYGDCHDLSELRNRDIEAKRKLIDLFAGVASDVDDDVPVSPHAGYANGLRDAVRLLAKGYASRPGYKPEWRP